VSHSMKNISVCGVLGKACCITCCITARKDHPFVRRFFRNRSPTDRSPIMPWEDPRPRGPHVEEFSIRLAARGDAGPPITESGASVVGRAQDPPLRMNHAAAA
jgi:hypothetical protein